MCGHHQRRLPLPLADHLRRLIIQFLSCRRFRFFCLLGQRLVVSPTGLLLRWSDAGDYTSWTPTATNQAGSYVIPQGSYIVGGLASGLAVLIWTDVGVTAMTYQGLPFVFVFPAGRHWLRPVWSSCIRRDRNPISYGLLGQQTRAGPNTQTPIGFFRMTLGATPPIPMECPVWDIFVANANFCEGFRLFIAVTEQFNEFELFFPLLTTSSFYRAGVIEWPPISFHNILDNAWDYNFSAQLQRIYGMGTYLACRDTCGWGYSWPYPAT